MSYFCLFCLLVLPYYVINKVEYNKLSSYRAATTTVTANVPLPFEDSRLVIGSVGFIGQRRQRTAHRSLDCNCAGRERFDVRYDPTHDAR